MSASASLSENAPPLQTLLGTHLAQLVGRHMRHVPVVVDRNALRLRVVQSVTLVSRAPTEVLLEAVLELDQIAQLECAELLPLFAAIEKRCPGLLERLPRCKQYVEHLELAARLAQIFSLETLNRLRDALRDYQTGGELDV